MRYAFSALLAILFMVPGLSQAGESHLILIYSGDNGETLALDTDGRCAFRTPSSSTSMIGTWSYERGVIATRFGPQSGFLKGISNRGYSMSKDGETLSWTQESVQVSPGRYGHATDKFVYNTVDFHLTKKIRVP